MNYAAFGPASPILLVLDKQNPYKGGMFNRSKAQALKAAKGIQTKWLAQRCGVRSDTISAYLSEKRGSDGPNPSLAVVRLMAQALGVPESELWDEQEKKRSA